MFVRKTTNQRGVVSYAVVESVRDPEARNRPRHRKLISLGRHPTAMAALAAEQKRWEGICSALDALKAGPDQGGAVGRRVERLERLRMESAGKWHDLHPFAVIEAAEDAVAAADLGQPIRTKPPGLAQKAVTVKKRPYLWRRFVARELSLDEAARLAGKRAGQDEKEWLKENA